MKRQSRTNNSDKFVHPQTSKTQDAGLFDELTQINVENLGYELGKKFRQGIAKEIANIGTRRKQGAAIVELQTKRAVESVKEKLQRQQQQQQQKEQQEHQQQQQDDDDDEDNGEEASTNEIDQTPLDEFVSVDLSISSQQQPSPKPKGPHAQQASKATNKTTTREDGSSSNNDNYTLGAHAKYLHLGAEGNGRYHYCDVSHLFLDDLKDDDDDDNYDDGYLKEHTPPPNLIKDYISPISFPELQKLYFGLEPSSQGSGSSEPLPVRTLAIRIRPDVKSRIVIDAVQRAFDDLDPSRCIILQNHECHFRYAMRQSVAPFVIDSQLCTSRIIVENNDNQQQDSSAGLERYLVLRVFPIIDYTQVLIVEDGDNPNNPVGTDAASDSQSKDPIPDEPFRLNLQLKEASSLLQFLHKYSNNAGMDDDVNKANHPQSCRMPSLRKSQKGTTTYFLERSSYKESMAVRKVSNKNKKNAIKATGDSATTTTTTDTTTRGDMILPALSKEDWATLQSSSTVLQKIWDR
jgi:hypothetical protein